MDEPLVHSRATCDPLPFPPEAPYELLHVVVRPRIRGRTCETARFRISLFAIPAKRTSFLSLLSSPYSEENAAFYPQPLRFLSLFSSISRNFSNIL